MGGERGVVGRRHAFVGEDLGAMAFTGEVFRLGGGDGGGGLVDLEPKTTPTLPLSGGVATESGGDGKGGRLDLGSRPAIPGGVADRGG